jgi:hypothetical protein
MASRKVESSATPDEGALPLPRGPAKRANAGRHRLASICTRRGPPGFGARVTWPMREAPLRRLQAERSRTEKSLPVATAPATWILAGPTNIGGRCTSLVCDPSKQ